MDLWTSLTKGELHDIADRVGVRAELDGPFPARRHNHSRFHLRLRLDGEKYRRISHMGRKVASVCWHGHRDFMRLLFAQDEHARIKSAFADYRGSDDFEDSFEATGDQNIGSMVSPLPMREACTCREAHGAARYRQLTRF